MTNVYLLSADADSAANIRASIASIGAIEVHNCAWVFPWSQGFASLLAWIRSLLPRSHARVVIAEITGDYVRL